jgi:mRNA interferase RelE/StbE
MSVQYEVLVDARVEKELQRVPSIDVARILDAMESLAIEPRPAGTRKLATQPGWRIRVGSYRILYEIDDKAHQIKIYRAGNRRDIYR